MATCRPTPVGMFCVGKDNICLIEDVTGNSSPHTSHFTLSQLFPQMYETLSYIVPSTQLGLSFRFRSDIILSSSIVMNILDTYYVIRLFWAKNDMQCDPFDPPTNANFAEKMEFPLFRILFSPFSS